MPSSSEDQAFRQRIQRVETLIQQIEAASDPAGRANFQELVQTLLDYHGTGLARMLDIVSEAGAQGQEIRTALARDGLVGSLLLLYGLHPLDFETRVCQALDRVRLVLRGHGGKVELVDTAGGMVRVRIEANGHICGSSARTVHTAIEEAIYEAAPEAAGITIEGLQEQDGPAVTFVPVEDLVGAGGLLRR
jgi:Fe-S cluster biogenesis protein NfuA